MTKYLLIAGLGGLLKISAAEPGTQSTNDIAKGEAAAALRENPGLTRQLVDRITEAAMDGRYREATNDFAALRKLKPLTGKGPVLAEPFAALAIYKTGQPAAAIALISNWTNEIPYDLKSALARLERVQTKIEPSSDLSLKIDEVKTFLRKKHP